jgi:hypothetical protein
MTTDRTVWTDERIDDMVDRLDKNIDRLDTHIDRLDTRVESLHVEMREGFARVDARFDAMFSRLYGMYGLIVFVLVTILAKM